MKFNEDILKAMDLEVKEERTPVNVLQVNEALEFMRACAERISRKSLHYIEDINIETRMDCMDIVTAKLNDFAQVFMDLMIFIRKAEGTYKTGNSLRYCIASFDTFDFEQSEEEQIFLKELLLRNEITHDYFNRELHQQKLIWIMTNCSQGALDVYSDLETYCKNHHLLEKYIDKNE